MPGQRPISFTGFLGGGKDVRYNFVRGSASGPQTFFFDDRFAQLTSLRFSSSDAFQFDDMGVFTGDAPCPSSIPVPAALPLFGSVLDAFSILGWRRKRACG
ncbi:MAG: hypothetical protein AAF607_10385 [Pseudomonadota bacterium]